MNEKDSARLLTCLIVRPNTLIFVITQIVELDARTAAAVRSSLSHPYGTLKTANEIAKMNFGLVEFYVI
jgi:hypothetical protein